MKKKPIYLWKSLMKGAISGHGAHKWRMNKWYKIKGSLNICQNGFHASELIIDAMQYCDMEVLAKVEVRGKSIKQEDKQCWSEMRVIKKWIRKKQDSVKLAIYSADLVLDNFERKYPDDKRPRLAIKAAKDYLKGKDVNLAAAKATKAAWSAAESAAWSAESAAWSAARSAESAESAASAAARSAAESEARSAARAAAESAVESAARLAAWAAAKAASLSAKAAARPARSARSAARAATWSAAESAAKAAAKAAWSTARPAWSAESAAWSAARSAARSAAKKTCHNWIVNHINQL